ncbi:MAG: RNA polymerase sigma factor [Candidatus Izemoplasmatales bacterium]|jgi:RNA polymerase sigma-70 factor (ECF subfamily)
MEDNLERLVCRLKNGEVQVFDKIYELTYRKVYFKIIPILRDVSLTEDIMQDTYIKLLSTIQNYRQKNFIGYLLTIARNLALNELKRRKREITTEEIVYDNSQFDYQTLVESKAENRALIERALSVLDNEERNVVLLHDVENLKHKEIAAIIDKPLGTVTWLYSRAIKKIRSVIKEEGWQ